VSSAKAAEPIETTFGTWTPVGPMNHVLDGDAHWRHLANITESSVRGGDAALCQITSTTCLNAVLLSVTSWCRSNSRLFQTTEQPKQKPRSPTFVLVLGSTYFAVSVVLNQRVCRQLQRLY